jgi:membrane associated rhomboid family serine protease
MELGFIIVIILANVALSLYAFSNEGVYRKMLFNPYLAFHNKEWYRVLTHAFVHADFLHLLFNMYVLYMFGTYIEQIFTDPEMFGRLFPGLEFWGTGRGYLYLFVLYFGGLTAATLPAFQKHRDNPAYNSVGASGAVSAIVMAIILLLPTMKLYLFFIPIGFPAFAMGGAYLAYEYYMSKRMSTGIAHDAHLWGGLFGLVFTLLIEPRFGLFFFERIGAFLGW